MGRTFNFLMLMLVVRIITTVNLDTSRTSPAITNGQSTDRTRKNCAASRKIRRLCTAVAMTSLRLKFVGLTVDVSSCHVMAAFSILMKRNKHRDTCNIILTFMSNLDGEKPSRNSESVFNIKCQLVSKNSRNTAIKT